MSGPLTDRRAQAVVDFAHVQARLDEIADKLHYGDIRGARVRVEALHEDWLTVLAESLKAIEDSEECTPSGYLRDGGIEVEPTKRRTT